MSIYELLLLIRQAIEESAKNRAQDCEIQDKLTTLQISLRRNDGSKKQFIVTVMEVI